MVLSVGSEIVARPRARSAKREHGTYHLTVKLSRALLIHPYTRIAAKEQLVLLCQWLVTERLVKSGEPI